MEKWVWEAAMLGECPPNGKIKNGKYPLKTHYSIIPLFHYSMIEAVTKNIR